MKKGNARQEAVRILRKVAFEGDHLDSEEIREIREIGDGCVMENLSHSIRRCDNCENGFRYVSIAKKGKEFLRKNDTKGKKLLIGLLEDIMISLVKSKVTVGLTKEEHDFLNDYGVKLTFSDEKRSTVLVDGNFKRHIAKLIHLLFNENEYCEVE